jgi:hypothetical protein
MKLSSGCASLKPAASVKGCSPQTGRLVPPPQYPPHLLVTLTSTSHLFAPLAKRGRVSRFVFGSDLAWFAAALLFAGIFGCCLCAYAVFCGLCNGTRVCYYLFGTTAGSAAGGAASASLMLATVLFASVPYDYMPVWAPVLGLIGSLPPPLIAYRMLHIEEAGAAGAGAGAAGAEQAGASARAAAVPIDAQQPASTDPKPVAIEMQAK